ncbi:MAG: hypothetical protein IKF19_04740 [Bacilli bacterium]|nr:hypothetical protein [Bacilli bacterium]MBR3162019.1 hypothetical protein [Bacilli bacterium]
MEKIDLNHWFIGDNSLSISFSNFWVDIEVRSINGIVYAQLKLLDSDMQTFAFDFVTLEAAVNFTENVINKYRNFQKVTVIYEDNYKQEVVNLFSNMNNNSYDGIELTVKESKKRLILD